MRLIRIHHQTRYRYAETVSLLPHTLHLRPRDGHDIRVQSSRLVITPTFEIDWKRDVYGNSVALVRFLETTDELSITSDVMVENYTVTAPDFAIEDYARSFPFDYDPAESIDLAPYQALIFPQDRQALKNWIEGNCNPVVKADTIGMLTSLNARIADTFEYIIREQPGVQSPAQTLEMCKGSCRDFAALFIETCRMCGLASRFISGYVMNDAVQEGHTATHAWAEVYLPGSGWRGFDPTSGQLVSGDHIAVAVHRHPEAIPPIAGSFMGTKDANPDLHVEVRVAPVES
jgi:transglutaminase-like putative cysteine protease